MRLACLATCLALAALPACTTTPQPNAAPISAGTATQAGGIRAVLVAQAEAWNRGDIEGFMDGYWRSEELRFASGGTVNRGWQMTHDRYIARYGTDASTMGALSFSDLEIVPLAADAAVVHGAWKLVFANGDTPGGLFTLVFRRIDGQWLIVSDTTTSAG